MVLGAAVLVVFFVGAVVLCATFIGTQMYLMIRTSKTSQSTSLIYPYHHTMVPYMI